MKKKLKCTNPSDGALLGDYLKGELSAPEKELFLKHIELCLKCYWRVLEKTKGEIIQKKIKKKET